MDVVAVDNAPHAPTGHLGLIDEQGVDTTSQLASGTFDDARREGT